MARTILCILFLLVPASSMALEGLEEGGKPPSFALADLEGGRVTPEYFEGGPGVIIFWSTWSPRSREILEDFRRYHERWAAEGLKIAAVNADGERLDGAGLEAVRLMAGELELPFPVLLDEGLTTYAAYGVMALPSAVVLDGEGRVSYALGGYPLTYREELRESFLAVLDIDGDGPPPAALAEGRGGEDGPAAPAGEAGTPATACAIPRARYCSLAAERQFSSSDPSVMAVRLSACRGDVEGAERMLRGVSRESLVGADLHFALAHLMLLKGRTAEANRAFSSLRRRRPLENWGEWGLGITSLAVGDVQGALEHMRSAGAGGELMPEAETAVLKYMEEHWRSGRPAPGEEHFLALFKDLDSVRACYRGRDGDG